MTIQKKQMLLRTLVVLLCLCSNAAFSQSISGHLRVCLGASRTTLTIGTTGGNWSSDNPARATIDATTGEVTGVSAGTTTISYTILPSTVFTAVVTVNAYTMSAIGFSTGSATRCTGSYPATCTVSPISGNNWTSSNTSIATVNTGGLVTPSASNTGTVLISYRHSYGNCYVTREMTVSPTPTVSISSVMCNGTTQTATATPSGGTWSSSNTSVGTINTTTGVMSGLAGGGANIYYVATTGCNKTTNVTVTALPAGITGSLTVCEGNTTTLASATGGGVWSSSSTSAASIGSSTGIVTGIAAGVSTISYTIGGTCARTAVVTVNGTLASNTGPDVVCVGQTITLTNATGGGTWSSSNTLKATVNSSGVVSGISAGTANISYRVGSGCYSITTVTVNSAAAAIGGGSNVCIDASVTLTHAVSGGTWSISNSNATIGSSSGVVTGVTAGSSVVTYTIGAGCYKTVLIQVKANPAAIAGAATLCAGTTITLTDATTGGAWSSSNTAVATIGSATGIVTGVTNGITTITYLVSVTGCHALHEVTVNSTAGSISGTLGICAGGTSTLSSSAGGGTWTSGSAAVATIGSTSGVVTAVGTGTSAITYSNGSGCTSVVVVSVSVAPGSIGGTASLCVGMTSTLTNSASGGTWSSSTPAVATVGSSSGILSAVSTGTSIITYSLGAGCTTTVVVSVLSTPGVITGTFTLCAGATTTLGNSASGGTWTSGSPSVATIGSSSGTVNALAAGTSVIYYTLSSGCVSATTVTVTTAPGSIGGATSFCAGTTTTLTNAEGGGTWTSSNTGVATIGSATGVVAGVSNGTTSITYTLGTGCLVTRDVTVHSTAASISGTLAICMGGTSTLGSSASGGTWISGNTSVATIDSSSGSITTVAAGTTIVTYAMGACSATATVTVSAAPGSITGTLSVTTGGTTTLSNATPGGTWTSSNTSVATVGSSSGIVNGFTAGIATISYSLGSGCAATVAVTVSASSASSCYSTWMQLAGNYQLVPEFDVELINLTTDACGVPYLAMSNPAIGPLIAPSTRVLKYDGGKFVQLGPKVSTTYGGYISVAVAPDGTPYVAYCDDGNSDRTTVKKYDGSAWVTVGGAPVSVAAGYHISLKIDNSGIPYVGYVDIANGAKATVMKFNGASWEAVGSVGFSATAVSNLTMDLDDSNTPYVAYQASTPGPEVWKIEAMKFNGSAWAVLGTDDSALVGLDPSIAVAGDGTPYVGISGGAGGKVRRFNGSTWEDVGTPINLYSGNVMIGNDNQPWVAVSLSGEESTVFRFNGSSWVPAVASCPMSPDYGGLSAAISPTGEVYLGVEMNSAVVAKLDAGTYEFMGGERGIGGYNSYPDYCKTSPVAFDASGTPYIGYLENHGPRVRKFIGGSWRPVKAGNPVWDAAIPPSGNATLLDIAINPGGEIYAAYSGGPAGVAASKFDGSDWSVVGAALSTGLPASLDLELNSAGVPYVAYDLWDGGPTVEVKKFDGSAWVNVGPDFGETAAGYLSMAIDNSGTPYVFYSEGWGVWERGMVKKYDGSSWVTVGSGYCTPDSTKYNDLAIAADGTPYIVYADGSNGYKVAVKKFVSGSWVSVGTDGFSTGAVSFTSIAVNAAGVPYVSFADVTNDNKVTVMMFNGSSWVVTGAAGFSKEDAVQTHITLDISGTPYVSGLYRPIFWEEPMVMKFSSPAEMSGDPNICIGASKSFHSLGGGTWSSSAPSIATVDCAGMVKGIAAGTATITYVFDTCYTTMVVTVNASPDAGMITGASIIGFGSSTTLSASVSGGVWSSGSTATATVTSTGGVVTAGGFGTTTIKYTVTSGGCSSYALHPLTVAFLKPGVTHNRETELAFSVYPNPASGNFKLASGVVGTASVFTIDGRVLLELKVEAGVTNISMPEGVAGGMYLLRFKGNDGSTYVTRLICQP